MAVQLVFGKAFEYACLKSIYEYLHSSQEVVIEANKAYNLAKEFYENSSDDVKEKLDRGANAAIKCILRLEPQLENSQNNTPLHLGIQEDAAGIQGDVRDVICIRKQNDWEIGISCKHNHNAVKHSRLSQKIDFGKMWFDRPCSKDYFEEITPLFDELRMLKESGVKWSEIEDKDDKVYVPLLNAFMKELKRLDADNPGDVPYRLLKYLIGRNDFYKVITLENKKMTQIQAYNMFNTLNRSSGGVRPQVRIPQLVLPNKIFDINFKKNSKNTIELVCNEGWTVSLRIHNASTIVEPSLKFDVTLKGIPPYLYSHFEPWD
jgi:hypothetical protein